MKNVIFSLLMTCLLTRVNGASLIVDSFTEGAVELTAGGIDREVSNLTTPFGKTRYTEITFRGVATGTILTASLKPNSGQLEFVANGETTNPNRRLYLELYYVGGAYEGIEPASIIGYTGVVFSFSALSGEGGIEVATRPSAVVSGDAENRIPLTEAGEVFYPIEKINYESWQSPEAISSLYFLFTATSEQFSFTLDEIRFVVPEPASLALLASGTALVLCRRRASFTSPLS